jgi:quinol monooxygenase YgiN
MAIGIVARLKIQPGKNEEFEATFSELEAVVSETEPGNNFYALHKSRADENTYIVLEQYTDQAALDVHGKSDQFKSVSAKLGDCMAGRPEIEIMDSTS